MTCCRPCSSVRRLAGALATGPDLQAPGCSSLLGQAAGTSDERTGRLGSRLVRASGGARGKREKKKKNDVAGVDGRMDGWMASLWRGPLAAPPPA